MILSPTLNIKRRYRLTFELVQYLNLEKIFNMFLGIVEKYLRLPYIRSSPVALMVEPTPFCQLRCPACAHSDPNFNKKFKKEDVLTKEKFAQIIDPIKKKLIWISFHVYGEPFMHPQLLEFAEYAHKNNIGVTFPTNFSFRFSDEKIKLIAESGIDKIFVSLDGASEETYSKYRIGGNFNQILSNVKRLADYKKAHKLKRPVLVWKFIKFDHNLHEADLVVKNYKPYGFDTYKYDYARNSPPEEARRLKRGKRSLKKKSPCFSLWHKMIVLSNGDVLACKSKYNIHMGNAFKSGLLGLWNNKTYQEMRKGFKKDNFPDKIPDTCKHCNRLSEIQQAETFASSKLNAL